MLADRRREEDELCERVRAAVEKVKTTERERLGFTAMNPSPTPNFYCASSRALGLYDEALRELKQCLGEFRRFSSRTSYQDDVIASR